MLLWSNFLLGSQLPTLAWIMTHSVTRQKGTRTAQVDGAMPTTRCLMKLLSMQIGTCLLLRNLAEEADHKASISPVIGSCHSGLLAVSSLGNLIAGNLCVP